MARRRLLTIALTTLGLTAGGLLAAPAQAADDGVISGVVKARPAGGTASVMADANVYAYLLDDQGFSEFAGSDTTDAQGRYSLTGLAAGDYEVRILPSDASGDTYAEEYYDDSWTAYGASAVSVDGATAALDDVVLEPAGWVTGRVTDETGAPLADASVDLRTTGTNGGYGVQTDADGYYDTRDGTYTADIIPGDYTVTGYGPFSDSLDDPVYDATERSVDIDPAAGATLDLVLPRVKTVVFTVTDAAGAPVTEAPVDLRIQRAAGGAFELPQYGPIQTDREGKFRVEAHVHAYKVGFHPADGGEEVSEWWDGGDGAAREAGATAITWPAGAPLKREHDVVLGALDATAPSITGAAVSGSTLTANPGTWTPAAPALAYQWLADGDPIQGATGPRLVLANRHAGAAISVAVTADHDGRTRTTTSAATRAVVGLLTSSKPRITGRSKVGRVLRVKPGAWGPRPVRLRYTWLRNGKVIKGARAASYKLRTVDRGKRIQVRVTGTKASYRTVTKASARTRKVSR